MHKNTQHKKIKSTTLASNEQHVCVCVFLLIGSVLINIVVNGQLCIYVN